MNYFNVSVIFTTEGRFIHSDSAAHMWLKQKNQSDQIRRKTNIMACLNFKERRQSKRYNNINKDIYI